MKLRIIFLVLIISFFNTEVLGNDTAILYKQRLEQIKSFSSWLNSKPNGQITFTNLDINSSIWKIYDTAFSLFFDKQIMDSLFQRNQEVLAISAKYQMQKIFLSNYDNLVDAVPFDSIKFKRIHQASKNIGSQNDQYGRRNTIILYFLIDGKEYEEFGLFFAENSAKLTSITGMGGDEGRNKMVKNYIERLKTAEKRN